MNYNKASIRSCCNLKKQGIKPKSDTMYLLYSLPAFDIGKPEIIQGNQILSGKLSINGDMILFNKLNVRFKRIWNLKNIDCYSICSSEFLPLVPNKLLIDQDYLYYCLISKEITDRMVSSSTGTSTSQQRINENLLLDYEIPLPELKIQKSIASILSSIDEKINNNKIIINNLREQGELIYKNWFESFGRFAGVCPVDWGKKSLGEVTYQIKEKINDRECKVLSAVNTGVLKFSDEYFNKQVYSKDIKKYYLIKEGEFAYNPARINIGSIGINDLGYDGAVSPVYVAFKVDERYQSFFEFYFKSKYFNEETKTRASGSVRQSLNYDEFSRIEIIYPTCDIANEFDKLWKEYKLRIKELNEENIKLESLKFLLLPKLMSGEIDVTDLKI